MDSRVGRPQLSLFTLPPRLVPGSHTSLAPKCLEKSWVRTLCPLDSTYSKAVYGHTEA